MSAVYRFRVIFEDYDDIHRDIDIRSTQTFEDFHQVIQAAIGFDASMTASFFRSNDNWIRGEEYTTVDKQGADGKPVKLMRDIRLCDFIEDPHEKIYYVSDAETPWTFFIELLRIVPADASKNYPVCVKSVGDAPKQYVVLTAAPVLSDEDLDEVEVTEDEKLVLEVETGVEEDEIQGMSEEGEAEAEEEEEVEESEASENEEGGEIGDTYNDQEDSGSRF